MRRIGSTPFSISRAAGIGLAVTLACVLVLTWITVAYAQMDDHYDSRTPPQETGSG